VPSNFSTYSDLKVNTLLLDGTAITADGALTITATGSTDLNLAAQGTIYNLSTSGATLATEATAIIDAINEVDGIAGTADTLSATLTAGNTTGAPKIEFDNANSGLISTQGTGAGAGIPISIIPGIGGASGDGGALTLESGQGGADGEGGLLSLTSGAGGGLTGGSGDVHIRVGSVTSGTLGSIEIGNVSALGVSIGRTGQTTIVNGALTSTQLLTATAGMSVGAAQAITGSGALTITNTGVLTIGNGSTTTLEISQAGNATNINGSLTVDQTSTHTGLADFDAGMTVATGQAITGDGTLTLTNTGALTIGNGNTTTVSLSQTGQNTSILGSMSVAQTSTHTGSADFDAGITVAASQSIQGDAAMTVAAGAASDLTLGSRGSNITLMQLGETSLTGFSTATSIVGALNELQTGAASSSTVTVNLTNNSGATIVAGSVVYHTTADGECDDAVATADNNASRPIGFADAAILNTNSGAIILNGIATVRLLAAGQTTTPGTEVFLSLTAGECTTDASAITTAGNVIQSVGYITDDTAYAGAQTVEMVVQWGSRSVI
ncbi:MAG: beta strand repeat-containing protein, partial [Candidatus Thorarchaeota archaeon]